MNRRIVEKVEELKKQNSKTIKKFYLEAIKDVDENVLYTFEDEDIGQANGIITLFADSRCWEIEELLEYHGIYHFWHYKNDEMIYWFPNSTITTEFSKEEALKAFLSYAKKEKERASDVEFPQKAFDYLKDENHIPPNYELLFALRHPHEAWNDISKYVVFKNNKVIHGENIYDSDYTLALTNIKGLEEWAKEVFECIEKEEKI